MQTAEEVWLQSETEVRRERGRCREDVGDGEIEAREGGGRAGDSINWLRNSFAPGKVQPWNMPPQSDERSCGRETDHNGSRWQRKVDGVGVTGPKGRTTETDESRTDRQTDRERDRQMDRQEAQMHCEREAGDAKSCECSPLCSISNYCS